MKKLFLFLTILLAFIIAVHMVNALGLSVLPALIKANVIRGQQFDTLVTVNNPSSDEAIYSIKADDKIIDWVSFYMENQSSQISQIAVPAASSNSFIARFNIPKGASNGKYTSFIYVETLSNESVLGNSSSLSIKIPITTSLEVVGSQFLTGKVINITTTDTEINRLLRIKTEFQNTGDVKATPRIEVTFKKNGVEIANFVHNTTSVDVDSTLTIDSDCDTTGQTVGDYVANVKVYLNDKVIKEKDIDFKILERGTLTADGKVINSSSPETANSGTVSKIEAEFMNTGEIDLKAKISGEVYSNNELVDTLQSDEVLVKIGETETLTAYFKPTKEGTYLIKSNVVYEGKKEPLNDMSINVAGSTVTGMATSPGIYEILSNNVVIVIIIIIIIIISVVIYFKKIRETY